MRILCIIDCLGSGGAQRQMTYLACGLKQRGHDVELFLTHPAANHFRPEIEAAGIPIHGIDRRGRKGFSWRVLIAIRRLLRTGFDGAVSFQLSANGYAVLARLLLPTWHGRVVCSERTAYARPRSTVSRLNTWLTAMISDVTVANSHTCTASLRQLPCLSYRVLTIWNGFPNANAIHPAARFPSRNALRLLCVGRLSAAKNGTRLLQALLVLRNREGWMPALTWAGRPESDAASMVMQAEMRELLESHADLAAHCHFPGEVKAMSSLYALHDAMILPSLYEGLPNAVCEAMFAGCPVIASDIGDNGLLLGDGNRGVLCDPLAPESIADAISRFNNMMPSERTDMARRARQFAERELGLDAMVMGYESLLLGRKPPSA